MRQITFPDKYNVKMFKALWSEQEMALGACYGFEFSAEQNMSCCTCNIKRTAKQALINFITLSFRALMESPLREGERRGILNQIDSAYSEMNVARDLFCAEKTKSYWSKFYDHQKEGVIDSLGRNNNLLAFEQGLGKSITSATISRVLNLKRTLIVCIPVAKWNWHEDLCIKFGYNPLYFSILDSKKSKTIKAISPFHERFCITHYHALPKHMDYILSSNIDHIILDECTIIKNHNTAIFKNVQKIIEANPGIRISLLSGTPIKNRVDDLYAYFKLTGHTLGKNHAKFLREYANMKTGRNITKVVGAKNIDQLTVNMANFMIRKTEDECLDLPEVTYNKVMLDMDDYKEEYDKVLEELIQNKDKSPLSSSIISLNRILAMSKVKGAIELIDDLVEKGKKVVVFMSYKDPINMLEAHYGNSCVKVDGTVDHSERFVRVKKFRDDDNCKVFLGNIIAAGTSLNLTIATEVIFMNYPFTSTDIAQGVSRVKRIGQTNKMRVYFLTCKDTIDEILYELVADKQSEINQIIDGGDGLDYQGGDIKDVLYKKIMEGAYVSS